jgi:hypothetical protein
MNTEENFALNKENEENNDIVKEETNQTVETTPEVTEVTPEVIDVTEVIPEVIEVTEVTEVTEVIPEVTEVIPEVTEVIEVKEVIPEVTEVIPEVTSEEILEESETDLDEKETVEETIDLTKLSREDLVLQLVEIYDKKLFGEKKNLFNQIRNEYRKRMADREKELIANFEANEEKPEFVYEQDEVDYRFKLLQTSIKQELDLLRDAEEKQKLKNYEQKLEVMETLRQLIDSEEKPLKEIYDEFAVLKEKWKKIGNVPLEKNNDLWMNYNALVMKFFDKVKIYRDLRDLDMQKNLEQKILLCEKLEDLLLEKSYKKSFQTMNEVWEEWQEIGPVPLTQKDTIWERFRKASDAVHQKRREHFAALNEDFEKNMLAKQALIVNLKQIVEEEFNSIKKWAETDKILVESMNLWKSIGRAGEKNDELWEEYRSLRNGYYTKKRAFFETMQESFANNLQAKINLCIQAEAISERSDFKKATEELLALQEEWKNIGMVGAAKQEAIWKRFRAAFDKFFDRKKEFFKSLSSSEKDNLDLKKALIEEIKNFENNNDKQQLLNHIKEFQKRWTEIGHVPMSMKDKLYEDFRGAIDNMLDKFKINPAELRNNKFVQRFANINNSDDAKNISNKEVFDLRNKINEIKNQISTYENNMSFLLRSKNMEVLKKEYEDKILKMKQEAALLESKLKLILSQ